MINFLSSFPRRRESIRASGYLLILCLISSAQLVEANPFCFARASSYYEQVYCELERKAQTKSIPPFDEFRKSSEQIQYSLLKRVADKNYIELPKPVATAIAAVAIEKKHLAVPSVTASPKKPQSTTPVDNRDRQRSKRVVAESNACHFQDQTIVCENQTFQLIGNKSNQKLKSGVLSEDYRMALNNYSSTENSNRENLDSFLASSYNQYLTKMSDIGLGGVTMTYTKFVYFYHDIQTKKLNFSKRFETMFTYLKKDKASMNASEKISFPKGLSLKDCDQISSGFWACDLAGTNYLFHNTSL